MKEKVQRKREDYQVVKRGREYHYCGEENIVVKRERVSNIIFPIILRLLGKISSGEEGKGTEITGKKIKIKQSGLGRISSCRELYTPLGPGSPASPHSPASRSVARSAIASIFLGFLSENLRITKYRLDILVLTKKSIRISCI